MDQLTELMNYECGSCGSTRWNLKIGRRTDGTTWLIVICGNDNCVEKKRKDLGIDSDTLVVWDELNISGQGHDYDHDYDPEDLN